MIYLDNAATSFPKAPGVARAVATAIDEAFGSAGRASSLPQLGGDRIIFEARSRLADFLGVRDSSRLVFTKNATEALNLVIRGYVKPGSLVALSSLEHNAVARPIRRLEREAGVKSLVFHCDEKGRPDPEELRAVLKARPSLLAVTAASNVTGAILPFEEIVRDFQKEGIPVLVDGSQALGHIPIDFDRLGASAFCFPGHKGLLGPQGTGAVCLASGFSPDPLLWGGTAGESRELEQPDSLPEGYEAGTQNVPALAGLAASLAWIQKTGLASIAAREAALRDRLAAGLKSLSPLRLLGPEAGQAAVPLVSCIPREKDMAQLALELGRRDIALRPGLHCSRLAHESLGSLDSGGSLRFSPGPFTTDREIDDTLMIMEELLR